MNPALDAVPRCLGAAVALFGAVVLTGWAAGLPALTRIVPGWNAVKGNTALCALLYGSSLVFLTLKRRPGARRLAGALAAAAFGMAALTVLEYAFGFEFGVDEFLIMDAPPPGYAHSHGRMAPATAGILSLFGPAFLLFDSKPPRSWLSEAFAWAGAAIALFCVFGYVLGSPESYTLGGDTAISQSTAAALLVLGLGIIALRTDRGLMALAASPGPGGRAFRSLVPFAVLMPLGLGWVRLWGERTGHFSSELGTSVVMSNIAFILVATAYIKGSAVDREDAERIRAETRRAVSDYNRSLIEASLDPLVTIGPDGKITDVNAATEAVTGRPRAALVGSDFSDYFTRPELARAGYQRVFEEGKVNDYPLELLGAGGRATPVLYNAAVYKGASGEVAGVFAAARDVTAQKRAEAEVRQLTAELEERVKLRTAQLEAANKELEAFAYSVSHDLRAPLRAVDGFSQILMEDHAPKLDEECRRLLGVVRESALTMGMLIDDLLAFSRMSRQALLKGRVDMAEVVRGAWGPLAKEAERRHLKFDVGPLAACNGDSALLKQVWTNLLSNGLKFTRGRAEAAVEVGSSTKEGETVYWVKDNGAGFDMRYADKLFKVFQRLHRSADFEGTGIGLAIVARIVERHGGRVWAEGEPGRGATFRFTLGGSDA
ncbi:PAS domain-containing sensor histidine kinase [bacterium]|nr:MAG: PAS domain-containing sensor histidine kinase [bacterium]